MDRPSQSYGVRAFPTGNSKKGVITLSWNAGRRCRSAQFNILEGFLEEAQLEVTNPNKESGPRLKIQWGRVILKDIGAQGECSDIQADMSRMQTGVDQQTA